MVDKNAPKYVFQKDGTYYFSRHDLSCLSNYDTLPNCLFR